MQTRMRHLQRVGIDNHVADGHDVDIYQSVNVVPGGITVAGAAQVAFHVVDAFEHGVRLEVAAEPHAQVEEAVVALKAPRLTLDNARGNAACSTCLHSNDGAIDIIAPIAYVTTYIQVIVH